MLARECVVSRQSANSAERGRSPCKRCNRPTSPGTIQARFCAAWRATSVLGRVPRKLWACRAELAKSGQCRSSSPDVGRVRADVGRSWGDVGRCLSSSGPIWGPDSTGPSRVSGRSGARLAPISSRCGADVLGWTSGRFGADMGPVLGRRRLRGLCAAATFLQLPG